MDSSLNASNVFEEINNSIFNDFVDLGYDKWDNNFVQDLSIDNEAVSGCEFSDHQSVFSNMNQAALEKHLHHIWEENEKLKEELKNFAAIKEEGDKIAANQKKILLALLTMPKNCDSVSSASESTDVTDGIEYRSDRSSWQSFTLDDSLNNVIATSSIANCDTSFDNDVAHTSLESIEIIRKSATPTQSFIKVTVEQIAAAKESYNDSIEAEIEGTGDKEIVEDKTFENFKTCIADNFERCRLEKDVKTKLMEYEQKQSAEDEQIHERLEDGQVSVNVLKQSMCTNFENDERLSVHANEWWKEEKAMIHQRVQNMDEEKASLHTERKQILDEYKALGQERAILAEEAKYLHNLKLGIEREKQEKLQEKLLEKSSQEVESLKDICTQLTKMLQGMQIECEAWRTEKENLRELIDHQKQLHDVEKSALEENVLLLTENCKKLTKKIEDANAEKEALRAEKENRLQEQKLLKEKHDYLNMQLMELRKTNEELLQKNTVLGDIVNTCSNMNQALLAKNQQMNSSEHVVNFYKAKVEKYENNIFKMMSSEKYYLKQIESMTYEINTLREWNKILASRPQHQQNVENEPYWN